MKLWWIVIAVTALVLGVGGYAWREHRIEASRCANVARLATDAPETDAPTVVVGDSYAAGFGLDSVADAWPYHLGQPVSVHAAPGAGWGRPGLCGAPTLTELASEHANTGTTILQGGLNDTLDDADAGVTGLAGLDLTGRVVVVGPPDVPGFEREALIDAEMEQAAADLGAEYVSLLELDVPVLADGMHPTPAGHVLIAEAVAVALH